MDAEICFPQIHKTAEVAACRPCFLFRNRSRARFSASDLPDRCIMSGLFPGRVNSCPVRWSEHEAAPPARRPCCVDPRLNQRCRPRTNNEAVPDDKLDGLEKLPSCVPSAPAGYPARQISAVIAAQLRKACISQVEVKPLHPESLTILRGNESFRSRFADAFRHCARITLPASPTRQRPPCPRLRSHGQ